MSQVNTELAKFDITPCYSNDFNIQTPPPVEPEVQLNYIFPCILVEGQYEVTSILILIYQNREHEIFILGEIQPREGFFAAAIRARVESNVLSAMHAFLELQGHN